MASLASGKENVDLVKGIAKNLEQLQDKDINSNQSEGRQHMSLNQLGSKLLPTTHCGDSSPNLASQTLKRRTAEAIQESKCIRLELQGQENKAKKYDENNYTSHERFSEAPEGTSPDKSEKESGGVFFNVVKSVKSCRKKKFEVKISPSTLCLPFFSTRIPLVTNYLLSKVLVIKQLTSDTHYTAA